MFILHSFTVFIVFNVALIHADVTEDKETGPNEDGRQDIDSLVTLVPRRFIDDLTDDEWHVAHLKRPKDDARKSGCKKTIEDQLKRYRKDMQSQGDFVGADPLPFDVKDLPEDGCKVEDQFDELTASETADTTSSVPQSVTPILRTEDSDINVNIPKSGHEEPVTNKMAKDVESVELVTESLVDDDPELDKIVQLSVTLNKETDANIEIENKMENDDLRSGVEVSVENAEVVKTNERNESIVEEITNENLPNTTETVQEGITTNKPKDKPKAGKRRSEYEFGSGEEYYDHVLEFDEASCPPNTVEVITPTQELLRDWDAECILNLEWRCLE